MPSRLPSLRAVAIFVAAGRALSFTEAAKTVNLTPSAVSRRIRALERELGTALFRRFNRRLELTAAGARYLAGVSQAIDLIERESEAIRPRRRGATLRLSVLQSFASLWLLPRLAAFKSLRPDIDVQVETSSELVDLVDERFDAAIRFGNGRWPGLVAERLFPVRLFPVAARGLLPAGKPISAAALDKTTLLDIAQAPDLWPQYLAGVGLARLSTAPQPDLRQRPGDVRGGGQWPRPGAGRARAGRAPAQVRPAGRALQQQAGGDPAKLLSRLHQGAAGPAGAQGAAPGAGSRALSAREATGSSFVARCGRPRSVR